MKELEVMIFNAHETRPKKKKNDTYRIRSDQELEQTK